MFITLLAIVISTQLFIAMGVSPSKKFGETSQAVLLKETSITATGPREFVTFGAGCFWGIELAFQRVPGIVSTEVGYTQGITKNPSYEDVCTGSTGHVEAVRVTYDSHAISLDDLLTVFWDIHDPTTYNRQGNDVGSQYRSGVYYSNDWQMTVIKASKEKEQKKYGNTPIVTEILPEVVWYPAEEYHQKYLEKGGQCSLKGDLTPIRCYG